MEVMSTCRYFLHEDAFICRIDDGAVMLDLTRNRYFALESQQVSDLDRHVHGLRNIRREDDGETHHEMACSTFIETLLNSGILVTTNGAARYDAAEFVGPIRSLREKDSAPSNASPRLHHIWTLGWAYVCVSMNLRFGRLRSMIHRLRGRKRSAETPRESPLRDGCELSSLMSVFLRLRPWLYTAHDKCLLDSLVLTAFLVEYGQSPTFVIGVSAKPFAAHAWVQVGDCVLDDRVERLQKLAPILVV